MEVARIAAVRRLKCCQTCVEQGNLFVGIGDECCWAERAARDAFVSCPCHPPSPRFPLRTVQRTSFRFKFAPSTTPCSKFRHFDDEPCGPTMVSPLRVGPHPRARPRTRTRHLRSRSTTCFRPLAVQIVPGPFQVHKIRSHRSHYPRTASHKHLSTIRDPRRLSHSGWRRFSLVVTISASDRSLDMVLDVVCQFGGRTRIQVGSLHKRAYCKSLPTSLLKSLLEKFIAILS